MTKLDKILILPIVCILTIVVASQFLLENNIYFIKLLKFINANKLAVSSLSLLVLTICILLKKILSNKDVFANFITLLGYIIIIVFTLIANDKWCYLGAMLIIGYNSRLIDEPLQKFILKLFNRDNPIESKILDNKSQYNDYEDSVEDENEKASNDNTDTSEPYTNSRKAEKLAIEYINKNFLTDFKTDIQLLEIHSKSTLRPDGFQKKNNNIYLLEVVMSNSNNINAIIDRCKKYTDKNIDFYEKYYNDSNGCFYQVVLVRDSFTKEDEEVLRTKFNNYIKQWLEKYDFKFIVIRKKELNL